MSSARKGGLELDEDMTFQRRQFVVERVGWIVMLAIILAALLGVFGSGPLSAATVEDRSAGVKLEYSRFARRSATTQLRIHVAPSAIEEHTILLRVGDEYLRRVDVESIFPEPERMMSDSGGLVAQVAVRAADRPAVITVDVAPRESGTLVLELRVGSGAPITVRQLVYP
jgi:hypothetical protein